MPRFNEGGDSGKLTKGMEVSGSKLSDPEYAAFALLETAKEARGDLSKFYGLVIKHELTQESLIPAPHQVLMFDFVTHHYKAVLRLPVGTAKTTGMGAMTLWLLGQDNTQRGAIVSRTSTQAQKVLVMARDYIEEPTLNPPLILTFPNFQKSTRPQDPWTQKALTIERPRGIRDPSLIAIGGDGKIEGSRLGWMLTDDLVHYDNSSTQNQRDDLRRKFFGSFMSRMDPVSRVVVTNTPWDRSDLTFYLEENVGWPTLTMDIYGFIRVTNPSAAWMNHALNEHLRPSNTRVDDQYDWYRLRALDPDPQEIKPLWAARYSADRIKEIRYGKSGIGEMPPMEFARTFMCQPMSEDAARCEKAWIEKCKARGMGETLVSEYTGPNPTYTGIDVGVGTERKHDLTVFFTAECLPDGSRRLLDIDSGRITGPAIIDKLLQKNQRYKSAVWVEGNAAQKYLVDFAKEKNKNINIRAHTTTKANKLNLDFGVESVFTELQNGSWIIPCDKNGVCEPEVQEWIDEMLFYQPPPAHTGDRLMANFIARQAMRRGNRGDPKPKVGRTREMASTGGF
jgi:hypothetical protein